MKTIAYSETKGFYQRLDKAVRNDTPVRITFKKKRLTKNAKLWRRLIRCKNGSAIKKEFLKAQAGKSSAVEAILTSQAMTACFTGGEIWLIAWIATLIAGVLLYGIYKERKVKFGLKMDSEGNPDGYIEVVPA